MTDRAALPWLAHRLELVGWELAFVRALLVQLRRQAETAAQAQSFSRMAQEASGPGQAQDAASPWLAAPPADPSIAGGQAARDLPFEGPQAPPHHAPDADLDYLRAYA